MTAGKEGRIVWHDLFTSDRQQSMLFYERVAGWTYKVEQATDFAWGGGKKDFVLAVLDNEAGAGLVETPPGLKDGWIPYVEVHDVDETAKLAEALGGGVVRPPFDVPGVGRNALLRDPLGARFGISLSRHEFPAPRRLFGPDVYVGKSTTFPERFYARLFDWKAASSTVREGEANAILAPSGERVAVSLVGLAITDLQPGWTPSLNVANPDAARDAVVPQEGELVETLVSDFAKGFQYIARDANGTLFFAVARISRNRS